ncbi:hypothetical protein COCVIDRAFT_15245 [Bipolaris victoriae FI3]|uniref:Uncharacterized protein n=1 Tax=Bipolaris victoriae (strain FI3) TaxID=930091 RepID=W7EIH7_BIPV3|nr:hypothetical protein COCVIDRAFT_15245 [Bipolaris victoriae FI3]
MSGCSIYTDSTSATSPLPLTAPWQAHGCALKVPGFGDPSSDKSKAAGLSFDQPGRPVQLSPRTPCIKAHCRVVQLQLQGSTAQHSTCPAVGLDGVWGSVGEVLFGASVFFHPCRRCQFSQASAPTGLRGHLACRSHARCPTPPRPLLRP